MNKSIRNTVFLDGTVPESVIKETTDISCGLIPENLPEKSSKR